MGFRGNTQGWGQGVKSPEADKSLSVTNTRQKSPSGCTLIEFYAAFLFCVYLLLPINFKKSISHSYSSCLHTHTLILNERMCEKTKIAIYLNLITLTDRQIPLMHLILKAKLLVQLKVTLTIKTIKICRPRARFELAISVLHLDQGFQD